jgi:hypothetical protein
MENLISVNVEINNFSGSNKHIKCFVENLFGESKYVSFPISHHNNVTEIIRILYKDGYKLIGIDILNIEPIVENENDISINFSKNYYFEK